MTKKIVLAVVGALCGAAAYYFGVVLGWDISKYSTNNEPQSFNWLYCLLAMGVGALIFALPTRTKHKK